MKHHRRRRTKDGQPLSVVCSVGLNRLGDYGLIKAQNSITSFIKSLVSIAQTQCFRLRTDCEFIYSIIKEKLKAFSLKA